VSKDHHVTIGYAFTKNNYIEIACK